MPFIIHQKSRSKEEAKQRQKNFKRILQKFKCKTTSLQKKMTKKANKSYNTNPTKSSNVVTMKDCNT